jgi:hypothetical protein
MRGSLNLCSCFSILITLALATFFLHTHALALAILRTLNLNPHMRNFLIDARCDTLDASSLGEWHARAMLREMCRTTRRALQATAGYHHWDGAFLY